MIKVKKFEEEENQENPGLKAGKTLLGRQLYSKVPYFTTFFLKICNNSKNYFFLSKIYIYCIYHFNLIFSSASASVVVVPRKIMTA